MDSDFAIQTHEYALIYTGGVKTFCHVNVNCEVKSSWTGRLKGFNINAPYL